MVQYMYFAFHFNVLSKKNLVQFQPGWTIVVPYYNFISQLHFPFKQIPIKIEIYSNCQNFKHLLKLNCSYLYYNGFLIFWVYDIEFFLIVCWICICFNRLQMPCLMLLYMKKMKMLDMKLYCCTKHIQSQRLSCL